GSHGVVNAAWSMQRGQCGVVNAAWAMWRGQCCEVNLARRRRCAKVPVDLTSAGVAQSLSVSHY
ncbi:hypothetical protein LSAT2_007343, partial [Lamellibrachia satsuma]